MVSTGGMTQLMQGKRGLIMGVANDHSIAWGIAQTLAAHGATLAFTYQGEALGRRVKPLAQSLGASLLLPCDVEQPASVDAVFAAIAEKWGSLDFLVHAIAFSDKNELKGRYADTTRENFTAHHADLLLLLHRGGQARGGIDAGGRRDADAHLQWRAAGDAELQRHGRGQGRAGSVGALSRGRFRAVRHPRQCHLRRSDPHAGRRRHQPMRGRCSPSSSGTRRCGAA